MSQSVCPPCFWDSGTQCGYVLRNTGQEREEQDAATQRQAGTRDMGLGYRWTVEAEAGLFSLASQRGSAGPREKCHLTPNSNPFYSVGIGSEIPSSAGKGERGGSELVNVV